MTDELNTQIRKQGLSKGLILGIILSALSIFSFYFMTTMASSFFLIIAGPIVFSVLLPIVLAIVFCGDLRKSIGGFWTFKQAVTGIFIMFFVAFLVNFLISNVLFAKVIEPNMVDKTEAAMVSAMGSMMEKSSADQAAIDQKMDELHTQFEEQKNPSIGKQVQGFAVSIIFAFVFALIFGAIFKKERPVYLSDTGDADPTL